MEAKIQTQPYLPELGLATRTMRTNGSSSRSSSKKRRTVVVRRLCTFQSSADSVSERNAGSRSDGIISPFQPEPIDTTERNSVDGLGVQARSANPIKERWSAHKRCIDLKDRLGYLKSTVHSDRQANREAHTGDGGKAAKLSIRLDQFPIRLVVRNLPSRGRILLRPNSRED